MNERPRTLMNGGESGVGTHRAYQADAVRVNQNCSEITLKEERPVDSSSDAVEKSVDRNPSPRPSPQRGEGEQSYSLSPLGRGSWVRGLPQPGDSTWMTRLAIISRVLAP
jgi:hypothetical protein